MTAANETFFDRERSRTIQICVVEDDGHVFKIDLKKFKIEIDRNGRDLSLVQETLNGQRPFSVPSSWSTASLAVNTVDIVTSRWSSLACVRMFEQTMLPLDWQIERVMLPSDTVR